MGSILPTFAVEMSDIESDPLLRIARWHLNQIDSTDTMPVEPLLALDHAIVATVFCAAVVEHKLTDFLCAPAIFIDEDGPRRFVGRLLTRYVLRLPATRKLQFLREQVPELKENPTVKKLDDLFTRRNQALHTTYTYQEVLMLHDQAYDRGFHGDVPASQLRLRGSLRSQGPTTAAIGNARGDYQTASDFLRDMFLVEPYQPWPPQWLERAKRSREGLP